MTQKEWGVLKWNTIHMNKTQKKLSEAGKKGNKKSYENHQLRRSELFKELSKLTDKFWLDVIQFSKHRWSNNDIEELIIKLRNND